MTVKVIMTKDGLTNNLICPSEEVANKEVRMYEGMGWTVKSRQVNPPMNNSLIQALNTIGKVGRSDTEVAEAGKEVNAIKKSKGKATKPVEDGLIKKETTKKKETK